MLRKPLVLVTMLAFVLLGATAAAAQSFSVFGGLGLGRLAVAENGTSVGDLEGGLALRAGAFYNWTERANAGVGIVFDRATGRLAHPDTSFALTGYNAAVQIIFDVADRPVDLGLMAGLGSYTLSKTTGGLSESTDAALGHLVGAYVRYPIGEKLHMTGDLVYRSTRFEHGFGGSPVDVGGWSAGVGVVFEF